MLLSSLYGSFTFMSLGQVPRPYEKTAILGSCCPGRLARLAAVLAGLQGWLARMLSDLSEETQAL